MVGVVPRPVRGRPVALEALALSRVAVLARPPPVRVALAEEPEQGVVRARGKRRGRARSRGAVPAGPARVALAHNLLTDVRHAVLAVAQGADGVGAQGQFLVGNHDVLDVVPAHRKRRDAVAAHGVLDGNRLRAPDRGRVVLDVQREALSRPEVDAVRVARLALPEHETVLQEQLHVARDRFYRLGHRVDLATHLLREGVRGLVPGLSLDVELVVAVLVVVHPPPLAQRALDGAEAAVLAGAVDVPALLVAVEEPRVLYALPVLDGHRVQERREAQSGIGQVRGLGHRAVVDRVVCGEAVGAERFRARVKGVARVDVVVDKGRVGFYVDRLAHDAGGLEHPLPAPDLAFSQKGVL